MEFVWAKNLGKEMNVSLAFRLEKKTSGGGLTLELCAANVYRVFVNGVFAAYGPARAAHGARPMSGSWPI